MIRYPPGVLVHFSDMTFVLLGEMTNSILSEARVMQIVPYRGSGRTYTGYAGCFTDAWLSFSRDILDHCAFVEYPIIREVTIDDG